MAAGDTLLDVFREIISTPRRGTFEENTERQFEELQRALRENGDEVDAPRPTSPSEREQIVVATIEAVYGDTRHKEEVRLIAAAALATLNRLPVSYQTIGDEFAMTRACPHLHSRRFEQKTGIRPLRAKKDQARATSKARATGRKRGDAPRTHRGSNVFALFPGLS
jgi:hypothetical protein